MIAKVMGSEGPERMWSQPYSRYYPGIFHEYQGKDIKKPQSGLLVPWLRFKPFTPECRPSAGLLNQTSLANNNKYLNTSAFTYITHQKCHNLVITAPELNITLMPHISFNVK
jgi:hypothetical protein